MRLLARLRGRSVAELVERASQRVHSLAEQIAPPSGRDGALDGLLREVLPSYRARFARADAWSTGLLGGHFFPCTDDLAATRAAVERMEPGFRDWCLDRATRALEGRFDLLGHTDVAWGLPIDWHREPHSGVRAPRVHWSRVRYLDPAAAGDHKLLWELNRHGSLVTFAQAACMTGDSRWADACFSWLDDWMRENPPSIGVNWASSLEVAFRAIAWIWALRLLDRPLPPELAMRVATHFTHAGRHLERYLSTYFSPNTHLTGEALGLLYLGTQLPQLRPAARWRDRGWRILMEQLPRHVLPDGVYFERTTWYHRYTVDFYLHALILAERNGLAVPAVLRDRLELALEHLASVTRPDGTMPLIGDDDGGKLVVLDGRGAEHTAAPLAQGAVLLARQDFAHVAARAGGELAWVLGAEGVQRFRGLNAEAPAWTSRAFEVGGYFTMRDGWGPTSSFMIVDCGPHGVMNCGHAHADLLAFDLTVAGRPILVDPGTATYTTEPSVRDRFRSSDVHNTVTVDGRSSSVIAGPFQWARVADFTVEAWSAGLEADFLQGSHDGYRDLRDSVVHRRSVLFVKAATLWVVWDELLAEGEHEVVATFQSAPGIEMQLDAPDRVSCRAGGELALAISVVSAPAGWAMTVERGEVSPGYGVRVVAPVTRLRARTMGAASIVTVLQAAPLDSWRSRVLGLRDLGAAPARLIQLVEGLR